MVGAEVTALEAGGGAAWVRRGTRRAARRMAGVGAIVPWDWGGRTCGNCACEKFRGMRQARDGQGGQRQRLVNVYRKQD